MSTRAELVRLVRDRRLRLARLREGVASVSFTDDALLTDIEDALLALGFAELALDDFDHAGLAVR